METPVFTGACSQMVGGIEAETLGKLDHQSLKVRGTGRRPVPGHIASRPAPVKAGRCRDSLAFGQILRTRKAHANWHARRRGDSRAFIFMLNNQTVKSGDRRQMEASAQPPV